MFNLKQYLAFGHPLRQAIFRKTNQAQRLRARLDCDNPQFAKPQHRGATPTRHKVGLAAGAYGRGLRNWINNTQRAAQAERLAKKQARS